MRKYALLATGEHGLAFVGRPTSCGEDLVFDSAEEAQGALAEYRDEHKDPDSMVEIVSFNAHLPPNPANIGGKEISVQKAKASLTDKQFIEDPNNWPRWPFLPMKRTVAGHFPDIGTIIDQDGKLSTIHLDVTPWDDHITEKLRTCKKLAYNSIDEMLADGWRID